MEDFDRNYEKPCTQCGAEMQWLEVFPNEICLACHAKGFDANKPIDANFIRTMGQ